MNMWANLSNQGTAMGETALCDVHQHHGERLYVWAAIDAARAADDWDGRTARVRCDGNDALECRVCGAGSAD